MAAVLKVSRQIEHENPTSSIDVHLLEEQSSQISSKSDLKRRSLTRRRTRKKNNKVNSGMASVIVVIWNQFLVQKYMTVPLK